MLFTSKNKKIKKTIQEIKAQGLSITAHWDAGGDQTPCSVQIGEKFAAAYNGIEIYDELRRCIVDKLELPNAGETYHTGNGFIDINDQEEVFIKFSAVWRTEYYEDFYPYYFYYKDETWLEEGEEDENKIYTDLKKIDLIYKTYPIEDSLDLTKMLDRAQVTFMGRINDDLDIENKLYLEIKQGDSSETSEERLQPYYDKLNEILINQFESIKKSEEPLLQQEGYTPFNSLILEAVLNKQSEVDCIIKPSNESFATYKDEIVILIP